MADTTLPSVTAEVTPPSLDTNDGQAVATSLQIAEHFAKRHGDVIRSIRNLGCSKGFSQRNSASADYYDEQRKPRPMYYVTRDGFAMLAMGFTGEAATPWKEAYIAAFNAMEASLRQMYVEPLSNDKQFRRGIPMHLKFKLQEQSYQISRRLAAEDQPTVRRNLYWQLRQVNDALGIPTEGVTELLGKDAGTLAQLEGGAA